MSTAAAALSTFGFTPFLKFIFIFQIVNFSYLLHFNFHWFLSSMVFILLITQHILIFCFASSPYSLQSTYLTYLDLHLCFLPPDSEHFALQLYPLFSLHPVSSFLFLSVFFHSFLTSISLFLDTPPPPPLPCTSFFTSSFFYFSSSLKLPRPCQSQRFWSMTSEVSISRFLITLNLLASLARLSNCIFIAFK